MSEQPQIPREAWAGLAAEFALGTLPPVERALAETLARREGAFAQMVADWHARLAPLADSIPEVTPSPAVLPRIEAEIEGGQRAATAAAGPPGLQVAQLYRRLRLWRFAAGALALATAILALLVAVPGLLRTPPAERFVAILGEGEQQPRFLVTVDLRGERVSVVAVGGLAEHSGDFELWLVSDQAAQPRSLGLLPTNGNEHLALQGLASPALLQDGLLAVSLEPPGGSPTGLPSGPVVYSGPLLAQPD